jgi:predicted lipid-binding transport protein (Tim44 family)
MLSRVGGFLAGGLLGGLVFGGSGGGMGLSDLLVLMFLGTLAWKMLRSGAEAAARRRGDGQAALAMGYDHPARTVDSSVDGGAGAAPGTPVFDQASLVETAHEIFRQVQTAWSARDMHPIAAVLTPEMLTTLQKDCDRIRAQSRVNHIEQIAIRTADLVEVWQENGQDYVTLRFDASLLDYTTEDATGAVVEGSPSEPTAFEEFWTFTRPVWAKAWRLTAIQQPAPSAH